MTKSWMEPQPASDQLKHFLAHGGARFDGTWEEYQDRARIRLRETKKEIWANIAILRERALSAAQKAFSDDPTEENYNAFSKQITLRNDQWVKGEGNPVDARTELQIMPYQDYLRTAHWRTKRNEALVAARHRCQACNGDHRLQVHHRTYERRGRELLGDLTVLCEDCHKTFHEHGKLRGE